MYLEHTPVTFLPIINREYLLEEFVFALVSEGGLEPP